jgi:hypothetical protein
LIAAEPGPPVARSLPRQRLRPGDGRPQFGTKVPPRRCDYEYLAHAAPREIRHVFRYDLSSLLPRLTTRSGASRDPTRPANDPPIASSRLPLVGKEPLNALSLGVRQDIADPSVHLRELSETATRRMDGTANDAFEL